MSFCVLLLQTVSTASELRKPIYWIVAAKAIDYEQMLLLMAGVKWDIREIMSQHNVYVDVLLKVMWRDCPFTLWALCSNMGVFGPERDEVGLKCCFVFS